MTEGVSLPRAATLSAALNGAAELLAKGGDGLEEQLLDLLDSAPGQPQALLMLVSGRRAAGDAQGACAILEALAEEQPDLASVQYEYGMLLASRKEHGAAIDALSQVVKLEPNHPSAWRALGDQFAAVGKTAQAADAYVRHFGISGAELQMMEAAAANEDQLASAEAMLREFLNINPTDVFAAWLLAGVGMRLKHDEDAEKLLKEALKRAPGFTQGRFLLAWALHNQTKEEEAIRELDALLQREPDNAEYLGLKGMALLTLGEYGKAIQCYEELIQKHPTHALGWTGYGGALKTIGRRDESIAALRRAIKLKPDSGQAWWTLASLRTFRFTPEDVQTLRRELQNRNVAEFDKAQLHHALGRALEDEARYAESFKQYAQGKALRRKMIPYNAGDTTETVRRIKAVFTPTFVRGLSGAGCKTPDPIFVVGLTRSGSTLVEQILASHSQVEGTSELRLVNFLAIRLPQRVPGSDQAYPEILRSIPSAEFERIGEEYLKRAQPHRKMSRPFFVDKTPANAQYAGFIHLMLPNAKIIDARRHPLSCGFANFRQFYPHGLAHTSDLAELGRYYRDYVDLMAHFDRVLPGRIHRVIYEEMVREPERQVRHLLEYCGLPFEENCLRFHETERAVFTPSSEQVRQPIFQEGIEQWKNYEAWLGPMKIALGDVLDAYPHLPPSFQKAA